MEKIARIFFLAGLILGGGITLSGCGARSTTREIISSSEAELQEDMDKEAGAVTESKEKAAKASQEPIPRKQETDLSEEKTEIPRKQETDLTEEDTEMYKNENDYELLYFFSKKDGKFYETWYGGTS